MKSTSNQGSMTTAVVNRIIYWARLKGGPSYKEAFMMLGSLWKTGLIHAAESSDNRVVEMEVHAEP